MEERKGALKTPAQKGGERLLLAGCLLLAALGAGTVLYYTLVPSRTVFQADCSDTLYWAMASYDAGALFSREFYYATLQPFGGLLLMLPFIPFFGFSLTTHLCGMTLFAVLFMGGLWFFVSALALRLPHRLALFGGVLLLLCGSAKLRELMWEHVIYYSLGMLFTLLMLGLLFRLQRALRPAGGVIQKKKAALWGALLFALTLLAGTDGLQVLLFCAVPLALALLAERFVDVERPLRSRLNLIAGGAAAGLGAAAALGLALVGVLSAGVRTAWYTDMHTVFTAAEEWAGHLLLLPMYWARLIGFNAYAGEEIAGAAGAAELLRLAAALLLAAVPAVAAARYRRIKDRRFHIVLWYHGFLSAIILLSHTVGSTANAYWRLAPMVFSSLVVSVWYLLLVLAEGRRWLRGAALAGAGLALVCALNVFTVFTIPTRGGQNQHLYDLAHTLRENGLARGYADFQVSQPVTLLSGNRVKVRYVSMDERGVAMFPYQTEPGWYANAAEGTRYFVVTKQEEYEQLLQHEAWQRLRERVSEELTSGPYLILVFTENPAAG